MAVYSWTEIEGFNNVRKHTTAYPDILDGNNLVTYRAKVKLHGVNNGIQIHSDGRIVCQGRTVELTPQDDNHGFAKWVHANEEAWKAVPTKDIIIYGEWVGPGVQKSVAVSSIPKKVFAVFAARYMDPQNNLLITMPADLEHLVHGIPDVYVLPWYNDVVKIDWTADMDDTYEPIKRINRWVGWIEENDPWVEETFGVKGTGEGLVFYPESHAGYNNFCNLTFKAKGEKHRVIKAPAAAQVNAEVAAGIDQFVDMVLTDARLEQGTRALMGEHKHEDVLSCLFCTSGELVFDKKLTGQFVNWIVADVQKETNDELIASNLTWQQVQKPISDKARTWYLNKAKGN